MEQLYRRTDSDTQFEFNCFIDEYDDIDIHFKDNIVQNNEYVNEQNFIAFDQYFNEKDSNAIIGTDSDEKVVNLPINEQIKIFPLKIGLLPTEYWAKKKTSYSLMDFITFHFKSRSTKNVRFEHKLFNALRITNYFPQLVSLFGIQWVSYDMISVNLTIFGSLLNLSHPSQSLISNQGSFLTHGFIEIPYLNTDNNTENLSEKQNIFYFKHICPLFSVAMSENDLLCCRFRFPSSQ